MDQLCKEGKLSTPMIQSWSKEHLRTKNSFRVPEKNQFLGKA
jgi:hypothetical protein